ncbi:MAG TPA: HPP family protein [Magnetospirillum sp.]|nr:HPP family protein [Magnetospirillum sp.]
MHRLTKILRSRGAPPPRPSLAHAAASWLGAATAIAAVAWLGEATGMPWLMAPFGASAVIVFGLPDSPLAQPRAVIGGHLISAAVGLIFLSLFPVAWWSLALAVASAVVLMQLTRTTHPPAGANPLVVMLTGAGWSFLATPVLAGAVMIVVVALACNNLAPGRRYPLWWA